MMELSNLSQYFDATLSNEDVTHPKPDPQIYQLAMKKLGVSANQCLIVEDNDNGVKAATGAGGFLLHVQSPHDVTYDAVKRAIESVEARRTKKNEKDN